MDDRGRSSTTTPEVGQFLYCPMRSPTRRDGESDSDFGHEEKRDLTVEDKNWTKLGTK